MTPIFYYINFSEYDFNQEGLIFRSKKAAYDYGKASFDEHGNESWQDYVDDGLFSVKEVTIYE